MKVAHVDAVHTRRTKPLRHALFAQPAQRPPIVGVAHIGLKTNDLAAARPQLRGRPLG